MGLRSKQARYRRSYMKGQCDVRWWLATSFIGAVKLFHDLPEWLFPNASRCGTLAAVWLRYIVSWECTVVGSTTRDNRVEVPCKAEFVASDGSLRQRQQP